MERLTVAHNGRFLVEETAFAPAGGAYGGAAVERLARFESFFEGLVAERDKRAAELEKLRGEGKKNSVQFREALGKKLLASNTLALLQTYGLE